MWRKGGCGLYPSLGTLSRDRDIEHEQEEQSERLLDLSRTYRLRIRDNACKTDRQSKHKRTTIVLVRGRGNEQERGREAIDKKRH